MVLKDTNGYPCYLNSNEIFGKPVKSVRRIRQITTASSIPNFFTQVTYIDDSKTDYTIDEKSHSEVVQLAEKEEGEEWKENLRLSNVSRPLRSLKVPTE